MAVPVVGVSPKPSADDDTLPVLVAAIPETLVLNDEPTIINNNKPQQFILNYLATAPHYYSGQHSLTHHHCRHQLMDLHSPILYKAGVYLNCSKNIVPIATS